MFKKTLLLWLVGLTALAAPQLVPASQNPAPPPAQGGRVTIRGAVTHTVTSEGIPGVGIALVPISVASGGAAAQELTAILLQQDPQSLREAGARAGASQEVIDRAVAQAEARRNALLGGGSTESFAVETDASGRFAIAGVPAGIYTLTAAREGHLYLQPNGAGAGSDTYNTQITVTAGQAVPDVSIRMVPGATVSGRVSDASGRPASNVQVNALRVVYQQGRPVLQSSAAKTTDDRGEFRLFYLAPGEYFIAAGQAGGARGVLLAQRGAVNSVTEVPVRTYYPREIDPALASRIRVAAGAEFAGVNVSVQSARVFNVRGQVTVTVPITAVVAGPRGQVRGGQVSMGLSPRNRTLGEQTGSTVGFALDANGTAAFQIAGVLPGEYDLVGRLTQPANPQGGDAAAAAAASGQIFARMPIDVRDNVEGIHFVISPLVELKGSVVVSGPSVTRPPTVRLNLIHQNFYAGFPQYGRGNAQAAADGSFVFPGVPSGEYALDVAIPTAGPRGSDAYVADILMGGASILDSGFTIDDKTPAPLQVVLNAGTGSVEGNVYAAGRKPAAGAMVVLVPVRHRRMPSLYRNVAADAAGHYAMRGIPPGDYALFCWEEFLPTAAQDDAYMEKYKGKGQAVTVRSLAASTADVTVIPRDSDVR